MLVQYAILFKIEEPKCIYTFKVFKKEMAIDKNTFPKAAVQAMVRNLSHRLQYPVSDINDLLSKRHGLPPQVAVGKGTVVLESLRGDIPASMFPLKDVSDVENKANKLYDQL
jgi:hypothetical protein